MILNDLALQKWAITNVSPFNIEHINPASLDLTLGYRYIDLLLNLDCNLSEGGNVSILPGHPILASTREYVHMPEDCAGMIFMKSSLARKGLDHILAGWIDPGFYGEITLELHSHIPIVIQQGQRICQLVLQRMEAPPARSYKVTGRYNGQVGPTKAR